jgi:hypothetical protein
MIPQVDPSLYRGKYWYKQQARRSSRVLDEKQCFLQQPTSTARDGADASEELSLLIKQTDYLIRSIELYPP